jgi:hypothetical protein
MPKVYGRPHGDVNGSARVGRPRGRRLNGIAQAAIALAEGKIGNLDKAPDRNLPEPTDAKKRLAGL